MLNVGAQSTEAMSFKALGQPKGTCGAALIGCFQILTVSSSAKFKSMLLS